MLNPLRDFVAFDLETTGLERDADEIIEIGAVRVSQGEIVDRMSCLLKAEKPLSAIVESLTGISTALLLESGIDLKSGLETFLKFIGDLPLVAHNSDFDTTFIGHALTKVGLSPISNRIYDSLLIARTAWPTMDSHRLETLVEKLNIPIQKAHRALPDAEQAALLWIKGQEKLATYSPKTLTTLRHILETGPIAWRELFTPSLAPFENPFSVTNLKPNPSSESVQPNSLTATLATATLDSIMNDGQGLESAFTSIGKKYEARPRQMRMAHLVERSFKERRFLAVDSEPGTGRMLANLIASVRAAQSNKRPVYIAVPGRARIESVLASELPILKTLFGKGLRVSILKPPSTYLSPRKFAAILAHPETRLRDEEKLALMPLITWLESTLEGDISESMGFNHERNRLLWSKLACESYLGEVGSHAYAVREQAIKAHLVFISHDLFFEDLSLDFVLLPTYEAIVFDEAHRLPEQGQNRLGRDVSFFRLKDILQLVAYSKTEETGLLAELERQTKLMDETQSPQPLALLEKLKEKVFEPERQLQKFFNKIGKHAQKRRKDGESRIRFSDKIVLEFGAGPESVFSAIEELSEILRGLANVFTGLAADLNKVTDKLRDFRIDLNHVSNPPLAIVNEGEEATRSPEEVFWIEDFPNPHRALIRSAPLNIGHVLAEKFLPQMDTVVMASPSLTLGEEFGFFTSQVGLNAFPDRLKTALVRAQSDEPQLDPIFIARFSPVLNNAAAAETMSGHILRGLKEFVRPALVYFTHIGMLKQIRTHLQTGLAESGRMVLAQHVDGSRESLLHLFRRRPNVCLLGTEAFTSNLTQGETIPEIIIVTKLPFPVPTEPITAAHLDQIQAAKENSLYDYLLPSSIMRLKQELNRMPRRMGQKQIIWIMDPRPLTEKYGRLYLRGLGREVIVCNTEDELMQKTKLALETP